MSVALVLLVGLPASWWGGGQATAAEQATPTAEELATLADRPDFPSQQQVAKLIAKLGDARYVVRRETEQRLIEMGQQAFDQIDDATSDPDPEIATSCHYLLSQMTIRWTRQDDPPRVKRLLREYNENDNDSKQYLISQLGALPDHQGLEALCRICRYDPEPAVAQQAAIELLRTGKIQIGLSPSESPRLRQAIGSSIRPAAHWIRLLALQLESPEKSVPLWREAIAKALTQADDRFALAQVAALQANWVRIELLQGNQEGFSKAIAQLLVAEEDGFEYKFQHLAKWVLDGEQPSFIELLFEKYDAKLAESKSGLYIAAIVRLKQGKADLAEELAKAALNHQSELAEESRVDESLRQAYLLNKEGQVEWAREELRFVAKNATVASTTHVLGCILLADLLHDWQLDKEAADSIALVTDPLKKDVAARNTYSQRLRQGMNDFDERLPSYNSLLARENYYRACHLLAEGDTKEQWKALENSVQSDSDNPDALIAMYLASEGDAARRKKVLQRIEMHRRVLDQKIAQNPSDAQSYNAWAWMVCNTEGDFRKAIRYSHLSLKIMPDRAGLLDTLACCYFAAGDIPKAVEHQSRAVELAPHTQVLSRRLKQFKKALADLGEKPKEKIGA